MRGVRIGINASVVGENPTGLGLYSINLVRELDRIRDDLVVYTSDPEVFGRLRNRVVRVSAVTRPEHSISGHLSRVLWLQSILRLRAQADGVGVILNTVPEGVLGSRIP